MPVNPEMVGAWYLQWLCNKYGDFKVAYAYTKPNGEKAWTKHRSVLECWHSDEGIKFLARANNRNILKCEIVLDMDDNISEGRLAHICDEIENYGLSYNAYFTGSKGYHIHIYSKQLAYRTEQQRERIREHLIKKFGCDPHKKSENTMIAMENRPHWKTGNTKSIVRCTA